MSSPARRKMRHDIRGCLNAIRLSTEVGRIAADQDELAHFLDCIDAELLKISEMVDSLVEELAPGLYLTSDSINARKN